MNIHFDKSLKGLFLETQKLSMDSLGYLTDATTSKRIQNEENEYIKAKSFGGFRKGSRIFLSKDIDTVLKEARLDKKHGKKA